MTEDNPVPSKGRIKKDLRHSDPFKLEERERFRRHRARFWRRLENERHFPRLYEEGDCDWLNSLKLNEGIECFRLYKKVLELEREEEFEKRFGHPLEPPRLRELRQKRERLRNQYVGEYGPRVLDQMEMHITEKRRENVRMEMEMTGEKDERIIKVEIALSDAEVKSAFTRVKHVLNCLDPQILNEQAPELYGKKEERFSPVDPDDHEVEVEDVSPYKKGKSVDPNRLRRYKHEIKTTAQLLEKLFQDVDEEESFTKTQMFKELRELNNLLLDFIKKWDSIFLEKRAESSVEGGGQSQSKGILASKRNALRRQHNSQRDDPQELFPDLLELETIEKDCLFKFPQPPKFITASAVGYTPTAILVV